MVVPVTMVVDEHHQLVIYIAKPNNDGSSCQRVLVEIWSAQEWLWSLIWYFHGVKPIRSDPSNDSWWFIYWVVPFNHHPTKSPHPRWFMIVFTSKWDDLWDMEKKTTTNNVSHRMMVRTGSRTWSYLILYIRSATVLSSVGNLLIKLGQRRLCRHNKFVDDFGNKR